MSACPRACPACPERSRGEQSRSKIPTLSERGPPHSFALATSREQNGRGHVPSHSICDRPSSSAVPALLTPLECADPKNALANPLQCALTNSLDLKPRRMNTYKKRGVGRVHFVPAEPASCRKVYRRASGPLPRPPRRTHPPPGSAMPAALNGNPLPCSGFELCPNLASWDITAGRAASRIRRLTAHANSSLTKHAENPGPGRRFANGQPLPQDFTPFAACAIVRRCNRLSKRQADGAIPRCGATHQGFCRITPPPEVRRRSRLCPAPPSEASGARAGQGNIRGSLCSSCAKSRC